jgi:hypothetical protein
VPVGALILLLARAGSSGGNDQIGEPKGYTIIVTSC